MSQIIFTQLIQWSTGQYSYLPWRVERTLYRTLVSEIMLQQTTVGTVLNHFENFLSKYPTLLDLAQATEEEVCVAWKGLGYYRRARNLRNVAIQINEQFKGEIPTHLESLLSLKGIGPYTANAIIAIGANKRGLAVDANLERVLARFYGIDDRKGLKLQQKIYQDFVEKKILKEMNKLNARELNEALMDLGRILCQARKASCSLCPLRVQCKAYALGTPEIYPREEIKLKLKEDLYLKLLRVVVRKKDKILFYQKDENEWLSGQWELPTFMLESNDKTNTQYPKIPMRKAYEIGLKIKTSITKYKIENFIIEMTAEEFEKLIGKEKKIYQFHKFDKKFNASTASLKSLKLVDLTF